MPDDDWKTEYKEWKDLKSFQIRLLEEGAQSQSQAWLINAMWCEWKEMKQLKETDLPRIQELYRKNDSDIPDTPK